ncbi:MAG TPA: UDP-4-amino-4,6-dideoxy-N-acetyl-beta-L-altrosamine transaminase [Candidatus Sulfotelmatobacter sp.]|jgi:UDP-4-amino-4,6-dideoxy-N-acetyl-beta-L-altrosamine transaminase|nr:UDP-4-amino-4,6-dideoxy-N-acetyl-beta-L-altrosamine transaminase [Candidatus Sulfotelmatobacter sp.]
MSATSASSQILAIDGGTPVRSTFLPYGHQSINEADIQAVVDTLRSDWLTTGPKVGEFEEAFAEKVGAKHAVSFSSGTAALHGAAFAAGLKPGDEAITSPLTFAATANCILYQGATPVFADVSRDTLNLDPEQVGRKITPRTRAILPVDYAGNPADLDAIRKLAADRGLADRGLIVIEDACHALGAEYRGRKVGSIADMTVFSFHPVKHITTGEGGMVTTDSAHFSETLRRFRNHGISSDARQRQAEGQWHYEMVLLGFNYRLPDIACALGIQQLTKLEANLARRREIAARYTAEFHEIPGVIVPAVRPEANPAWHLYPIRLDLQKLTAGRAQIFRALRAENIGVNVHYVPVHLHPYYRDRFGYKGGEFPVAEDAYSRLISLPMFHAMSDQDVEDVISAVRKVLSHHCG